MGSITKTAYLLYRSIADEDLLLTIMTSRRSNIRDRPNGLPSTTSSRRRDNDPAASAFVRTGYYPDFKHQTRDVTAVEHQQHVQQRQHEQSRRSSQFEQQQPHHQQQQQEIISDAVVVDVIPFADSSSTQAISTEPLQSTTSSSRRQSGPSTSRETTTQGTTAKGSDDNNLCQCSCSVDRRIVYWLVLLVGAVLAAIIVFVGVFCGMGYCGNETPPGSETTTNPPGSSKATAPSPTDPATAPTSQTSTQSPETRTPATFPPTPATNSPTPATISPTPATTSPMPVPREIAIASYINEITLAGREIIYPVQETTLALSEELALQWLIEEDPAGLDANRVDDKLHLRQRYGLVTLYFQTNGQAWKTTTDWLTGNTECNWFGIACKFLQQQSVVTKIDLHSNNLQGSLPPDVALLDSLEDFWLFRNGLTGSLPDSIGRWQNLKWFLVNDNRLEGTLPDSIGQWTALSRFVLFNNDFEGKLPDSIAT